MSMKSTVNEPTESQGIGRRFFVPFVLGVGCAVLLGLFALKQRMKKAGPQTPGPAAAEAVVAAQVRPPGQTEEPAAPASQAAAPVPDEIKPVTPPSRPVPVVAAGPAPARAVASAETRQMVEALMQLAPGAAPLSAEQAAAWRQSLQSLIQQGAAGIPAIRDILELNKDLVLGAGNAQMLGYDTVRVALFDALRQIGGTEGAQATLEALRGTGDPREILALARNLDSMAPGEHRQEMLDSA